MNDQRRGRLKEAKNLLVRASNIIDCALSEEQDCLDNMPENLLDGYRCEKMEDAIDNMESALDQIESALDGIEVAVG